MYERRAAVDNVYIPHPAPDAVISDDEGRMGGFLSVAKTLIVPAIISLILYLVITFVVVPVWKRYRGRYSSYLPLDTITTRTTSLRQRMQEAIVRWLTPSTWRADGERYTFSAQDGSGSDLDDGEGEELDEIDDRRREALSLDARRGRNEDGSRLSRDLEEGFRDDSDDDNEGNTADTRQVTHSPRS